MAKTPHEALMETLLAHTPSASAWLRDVLPARAAAELDWERFAPAEGRVLGLRLRRSAADRAFVVPRRGARDDPEATPVVLTIEHKSGRASDLVGQQLRYAVHLRQVHMRHERPPPVVIAVLLVHGRGRPLATGAPPHVRLAIAESADGTSPELARLQPRLPLVVDDLRGQSEAEILARPLPPAVQLVLLALRTFAVCEPDELLAAVERWAPLLREVGRGEPGGIVPHILLEAIGWYAVEVSDATEEQIEMALSKFVPEDEAPRMTTGQRIRIESHERGRQEGRVEGRVEGLVEGRQEGLKDARIEVLLRLLARRFGPLADDHRTRLATATMRQLDVWIDRVLDVRTIEDLFATAD